MHIKAGHGVASRVHENRAPLGLDTVDDKRDGNSRLGISVFKDHAFGKIGVGIFNGVKTHGNHRPFAFIILPTG